MARTPKATTGPGPAPAGAARRVEELLGQGKVREAVDAAKELARQAPGPATDELLVLAYSARIGQLRAEGLDRDARSLCDLVERRVPSSRARMAALREEGDLLADGFRGLLAALGKAEGDERKRLSALLSAKLVDPGVLADSPALEVDHPLRREAGAVRELFGAVTLGPLPEGAMAALDGVSRSSPLAPWKLLVRGIDSFYRGEAESVRRNVAAIPPESAVAPLGPLLLRLTDGPEAAPAGPAPVVELGERLSGGRGTLRSALGELERGFQEEDENLALRAVERVLAALPPSAVEARKRFALTLIVRWTKADFEPEAVPRALTQGIPRLERTRCSALTMERFDWDGAVEEWQAFLDARSQEPPPPSRREIATVLLRMAGLFPPDEEETAQSLGFCCASCMREDIRKGRLPAFLDREGLLQKAVEADPSRRAFQALFSLQAGADPAAAAKTANRWHILRPSDPEPLAFLVRDAERRRAWKEALELLDRADAERHLGPELRGRRLPVLVSKVQENIRRGQAAAAKAALTLAEKESLATDSEVAPFLATLEWGLSQRRKKPDPAATQEAARRLDAMAKNPAFAWILKTAVSRQVGKREIERERTVTPAECFQAVVRLQRLASRLDMDLGLDRGVMGEVPVLAQQHFEKAPLGELLEFCEGPLSGGWPHASFAATTIGIAADGPLLARFLVARARALMTRYDDGPAARTVEVLAAARALATKAGDPDALRAASLAGRKLRSLFFGHSALGASSHLGHRLLDEASVQTVLSAERKVANLSDTPARLVEESERRPPRRPSKKRTRRRSALENLILQLGDEDDDEPF